jgi:hypothetical protein
MMLLVHWLASLFYLISTSTDNGWVEQQGYLLLTDEEQYLFTYHKTLLMLMGDNVRPTNVVESLFIVMVTLLGACLNATIFANVAALVAQMSEVSGPVWLTQRVLHFSRALPLSTAGH